MASSRRPPKRQDIDEFEEMTGEVSREDAESQPEQPRTAQESIPRHNDLDEFEDLAGEVAREDDEREPE